MSLSGTIGLRAVATGCEGGGVRTKRCTVAGPTNRAAIRDFPRLLTPRGRLAETGDARWSDLTTRWPK